MKVTKKSIVLILLCYSLLNSCHDEPRCIGNNSIMPEPIRLVILDKDGNCLITKDTSPKLIYSLDSNGKKVYTNVSNSPNDFARILSSYDTLILKYKYYYEDGAISVGSANGEKTYYLDFGGKVDTIYLDFQENKKFDPCGPYQSKYYLNKYLLNGKEWEHEEITKPPFFIVRR